MPGKLAAARASREASERLAQLPRRTGSTQGGLPTELEDASQGVESTTFSRISGGGRVLRIGSTDASNGQHSHSPRYHPQSLPQPHLHDVPASSQSVTFMVSSGQHGQHGTPTATAAIAQHVPNNGGGGGGGGSGPTGGSTGSGGGGGASAPAAALPPRVPTVGASAPAAAGHPPLTPADPAAPPPPPPPTAVLASPHGGSSGHTSATFTGASIPTADSARGPSANGFHQRSSLHRVGAEEPEPLRASSGGAAAAGAAPVAAAAATTSGAAASASSPAGSAAATAAAAAAARGSHSSTHQPVGAALEHVWTAAAPVQRSRSITTAPTVHRHSRLRIAVTASEPSAASCSDGGGGNDGGGGVHAGVGDGLGSTSATTGGSLSPLHGAPRRQNGLELILGDVDSGAASAMAATAAAAAMPPGGASGGAAFPAPGKPGAETMSAWTASAARAFSGIDSSSQGGTPHGASIPRTESPIGRGLGALRRLTPAGSTGFGAVSELFEADGGGQAQELLSPESSCTVRQTPSDMEDEMLERARARRAIRSVTLANMALEPRSPDGPTASAAGSSVVARAPTAPAAVVACGAATAPGPAARAGAVLSGAGARDTAAPPARAPIRLNHQPGHHRRPPNRHASMPAMKREGGTSGGGVGVGGGARKSPLMRPPLSGGLLPEDGVPEDAEAEDAASLQYGALAEDGGGGGGAGDVASGYSRMPSDSPVTSQMSVTSSVMYGGPASTAQQRQVSMTSFPQALGALGGGGAAAAAAAAAASFAASAGGGGGSPSANASAAALASPPPPAPVSRLAGPAGVPPSLLVKLPDLREGSSGQRASFDDDMMRPSPAFLGGSGAFQVAAVNSPHLVSCAGLAERPSHVSSRMLSGAHVQHSTSLAALHKAVERLMLQDSGLYSKVQASMKGISSLAKETHKLAFVRDASGATVINQYVVVKTLGRGAFGKVKLCLNTLDGQLYAVKMINRAHLLRQLQKPARPLRRRAPPPRNTSDTGLLEIHHRTQTDGNLSISHTNLNSNFGNAAQAAAPARASMDDASPLAAIMREIAVMKKVDHPHVVRLHEVIDPPGSSYLMMVMEYCEGGCVMETRAQTGLAPLGEDTAREYFRQACLGLDYLHYNNVVHGDLKPENMLVSGTGLLKIADFGSSRFMGGDPMDATKTSCTPAFQSPEEISHMPINPFAADLWALACCLWCFVFGRLPFVGSCVVDIYRAILTRPHVFPQGIPCSPSLRDMLNRMLDKDPNKRLKLRDVGQHEWVTAGGLLPELQFLVSEGAGGGGGEAPAPPPVIHVTHAEQVNAIDRSSLVSLVRARLKEKACQTGEYLFKEGEEAHCVYMIMAGVVELTQHLRRPTAHNHGHGSPVAGGAGPAAAAGHGGDAAAHGPHGAGGGAGEVGEHDASFSVDLDESLTLDHQDTGQITEAMNIVDGKLHIDRQQAIEMRRRMQGNLLGDNAEYVVEVKGPGSVIGEIGMDNAAVATHRVSARARGPVTVVKLTEENFYKALLQMYGEGGNGGSAASTTLTASSISEAVTRGGGGGGAPAAGGGAPGLSAQHLMVMQYLEDSGSYAVFPPGPTSGAAGGAPGRFSMDIGAGPSTLGSRQSSSYYQQAHDHHHHHHHHHHHPSGNGSSQMQLRNHSTHGGGGGGASVRREVSRSKLQPTAGAAAAPRPSAPPESTAAAASPAEGGASGAKTISPTHGSSVLLAARGSGTFGATRALAMTGLTGGGSSRGGPEMHLMLGVLNTIHSMNASRGGGAGNSEGGIADL